jgi:UDPglucose 6-dehydrogenase
VQALIRAAEETELPLKVLQAVEDANDAQKNVLLNKIKHRFGADLSGKTFAVWGLAFKPNTDDMRVAPSIVLIEGLLDAGAEVVAYDPVAMTEARRVFGERAGLRYATSPLAAAQDSDALAIVTEWKEFRAPNFDALKSALKNPVVFDGRNMYVPEQMRQRGFEYDTIGRR